MSKWIIIALDTGTSVLEKSIALYLTDCGKIINIPNIVFVIKGKKTIIVDTGFESIERTWHVHHQKVYRNKDQELSNALKNIGVEPGKVEIVVHTHLHYDHCGNNYLFPKAKFFVQKRELEYAFVPLPGEETAYFSPLIGEKPSFWGTKFEIIEGDFELIDGIKLVTVPGHTPGSQAVLVDTEDGIYAIAGDAVILYENLERNIPIGAAYSRADAIHSMDKLRGVSNFIIPSHDPEIFERKPAIFPGKKKR